MISNCSPSLTSSYALLGSNRGPQDPFTGSLVTARYVTSTLTDGAIGKRLRDSVSGERKLSSSMGPWKSEGQTMGNKHTARDSGEGAMVDLECTLLLERRVTC